MKPNGRIPLLAVAVLTPGVLTEESISGLKRLPCDAPGDTAAELLEDVNEGRSQVCDIVCDGERVGCVVYEVRGTELIGHAALGHDHQHRTNLIDGILPGLEQLARSHGCSAVRFHTIRAGLIARGMEHGFRVSEVIMRKAIT